MAKGLTLKDVNALKCPPGKKDILHFDGKQRGLAIRVSANGGKSFLVQYTYAGIKRRIPLALGSFSEITLPTLAAARTAAAGYLGDVAKGLDPAADRKERARKAKQKAAEEALTLSTLIGQWAALRLADKRESYAAEAVRALRYAFGRDGSPSVEPYQASRGARSRQPDQGGQGRDGGAHGRLWPRLLWMGHQARLDRNEPLRQSPARAGRET